MCVQKSPTQIICILQRSWTLNLFVVWIPSFVFYVMCTRHTFVWMTLVAEYLVFLS